MKKESVNDLHEVGCSEGWSGRSIDIDGVCPVCGEPTINGCAPSGCGYSPVICDECGSAPCDGSC